MDCSAGYQGGATGPGAQLMTLDSGSANSAEMLWAGKDQRWLGSISRYSLFQIEMGQGEVFYTSSWL